ncbi:MAG: nuclear transport factor 2 family protein [Micropepsaceae bacterium]
MRLQHFAAVLLIAGTSTFLASCGGTESTASDETAIRDTNKKWMELIVKKDAKAIAESIYAENGEMLPPNMPKAVGRAAVEQGWNAFINIPGMQLTFETQALTFAKSGELAVETGTYKFVAGEGAAQTTELGKSVVTWIKKDGKWQVLTDMFSSDAPAAVPAATPAEAPAPAEGTPAPATEGAATPATPTAPPAH